MSVIAQQPTSMQQSRVRNAADTLESVVRSGASVVPGIDTFVLGLALWEGVVRFFGVPIYLLPAPSQVLATMAQLPLLVRIGLATFSEAVSGFVIGCSLGCLVAVICVRWRRLADALVPLSIASNAVPIVVLAPILGIWLGSTRPASLSRLW